MSEKKPAQAAGDFFAPGERFRGYVVERRLGSGGLGAVYLVRHEMMDLPYALKVLSPGLAKENPEYVKRFVREAKIASRIRHPNLVAVHDVGYDGDKGLYYLVMDYIAGGDLRVALAMGGPMDPAEAVRIVACVAGALAAGERYGVVHRDIKPENIMLQPDGSVRLVDLGVAKVRDTDSLKTAAKTVFGTPNYISPEQAVDSSQVDGRADVYSLGIVLYELLCGKRPYEGDSVSCVMRSLLSPAPVPDVRLANPAVPQKLALIVQMMCAKDPSKRLASASVLLETFARFGYEVPKTVAAADYGAIEPQTSADVDYAALTERAADKTLSFDTKDEEIRSFVASVKAKRRRRRALAAVVWTVAALAAAALAAWAWCAAPGHAAP